ncbi:hypothetical protein [Xanthomonas sp. 10-10]|uniref:Uncharacterized protein n=1 Tax=Xanthomonas sp. 10-10 TaxID=3115848 RepID=A0AAU7PAX8_9XANT
MQEQEMDVIAESLGRIRVALARVSAIWLLHWPNSPAWMAASC